MVAKAEEATASSDPSSAAAVQGTAKGRYLQLQPERQHFVDRADKSAKLTVPTLFQSDASAVKNMKIKDPDQSLGARGTNTLASKMVLSLLPVNTPFFKLNVDMLELKQEGQDDIKTEIENGLGVIERGVIKDIEDSGDVTVAFEVIKHLVVTGNALMYVGKNGSRMYDLNKYVVMRSPEGKWLEIVVVEMVSPSELTDEQKKLANASTGTTGGPSASKDVEVYTYVTRKDDRVEWHQEINGEKVPGTESSVPEDGNPWLPLRFMRVDGESYGRGYIEMYLGDLSSLEVLTKAVNDASLGAAKVVWLVRPNGSTSPRTLAKAENNSVISGDEQDVSTLRLDKSADLRVALEMIQSIERRLAYAFMINAEVLRDAERVTAEEVRFVAQELDDSLGGIYSVLAKDFQLPYVKRRLHLMRAKGKIPKLPNEISPAIVTGFAALGRGHDREKLIRYAKTIAEVVGSQALPQYLNMDEMAKRLAVADGIEVQGLLISEEQRKKEQQGAQQQQMMEQLSPEMIKQLGPMIQKQMEGQENGAAAQAAPAQAPTQG